MDEHCYDLGPQPPVRPDRPAVLTETPELPPGAEGPPDFEPESRRYEEAYSHYLRALDEFPKIRADWEMRHGAGPVRISVGSAAEAVDRAGSRYSIRMPAA